MIPALIAIAVISFLAMSISWWTTPSSSSRMDWTSSPMDRWVGGVLGSFVVLIMVGAYRRWGLFTVSPRSEEYTSELQSRGHLVCRLLLEKKKRKQTRRTDKKILRTRGGEE